MLGSLSATTKEKESEDMAKQPEGHWECSECGLHLRDIELFPGLYYGHWTNDWLEDRKEFSQICRGDAGGCNRNTVKWYSPEPPANPPRQDDLQARIDTWQRKTFGNSQSFAGMIAHLKREIDELVELREPEEMADCAILLFGMAAHAKVDLLGEVEKKFAIIQTRIYGEPDADNVIEHMAPTNPPRQDDEQEVPVGKCRTCGGLDIARRGPERHCWLCGHSWRSWVIEEPDCTEKEEPTEERQDADMSQYVGMLCEFYSLVTQVWFTAILGECAKGQGFNFLPEGSGVWHMNCRPHPQTVELIAAREEITATKKELSGLALTLRRHIMQRNEEVRGLEAERDTLKATVKACKMLTDTEEKT